MIKKGYEDLLAFFKGLSAPVLKPYPGWAAGKLWRRFYIAPELAVDPDFADASSPLWLISAPGAVGKSALAKKMATDAGAVYIDLAAAKSVASGSITGGLRTTGADAAYYAGSTTLLIDALDEARLKITQESFEDFIEDAAVLAQGRRIPTVLLGRSGIIDDVSLLLMERGAAFARLEIENFGRDASLRFIAEAICSAEDLASAGGGGASDASGGSKPGASLRKRIAQRRQEFEECAGRFLDMLDELSRGPSGDFSGYAPVLQAAASYFREEGLNYSKINRALSNIQDSRLLEGICRGILLREQAKLIGPFRGQLSPEDAASAYCPAEQLRLLSEHLSGLPLEIDFHSLPYKSRESYEEAINSQLRQHPFLSPRGGKAANAVFQAAIQTWELLHSRKAAPALYKSAANPLLHEFYFNWQAVYGRPQGRGNAAEMELEGGFRLSDAPAIFASFSASLGSGDGAYLSIEQNRAQDGAEISITRLERDSDCEWEAHAYAANVDGAVVFHDRLMNVELEGSRIDVVLAAEKEMELAAPMRISARSINFNCQTLSAYCGAPDEGIILLEAARAPESSPEKVRSARECLRIYWPGSNGHPWGGHANSMPSAPAASADDVTKALFSLCRLVISFRSHGRGAKSRYKGKLEHWRMEKDFGKEAREQLLEDGALSIDGPMYKLDAARLAELTGLSYQNAQDKAFSAKAQEYARKIMARRAK